jgi:subfamily B ATP-binding cassette protein MsbA
MLSAISAILDGFGLAMFIPLFQLADSDLSIQEQKKEFGELDFLIDFFYQNNIDLNILTIVLTVSFLFIGKGVFKFIESYYKVKVRLLFMTSVRMKLLDEMSRLNYLSFIHLDAGRIQNTISVEVTKLYSCFTSYFNTLQSFILLLIYLSLALLSNFQFAVLVIILGYLSNFAYKIIYSKTKFLSNKISILGHEFQSYLIQSVQYFKYLKATNSVEKYHSKIKEKIHHIEGSQTKIGFFDAILQSTREPLVLILILIVIYVQVSFFGGTITAVLLSLMFFYRSMNSILQLQTAYQLFLSNIGAISSTEFLSEEFRDNLETNEKLLELKSIRSLSISNLSFSYSGKKDVLKNLSLDIPIKGSVAFVGESGSGKTTLINILSGLFPSASGELLVNDKKLSEYNLQSYRNRIGYITQEPVIFNDTVYNNITFWDEKNENNLLKFRQALELASALDFVEEMQQMEDTILGDHGVFLSGGQRQRISISRELYRNSEILILDEATSALDSETEKVIQENIEKLKGKYTLIIIAHRLSTIRNVDQIYVLDKGKISYSGSFNELLNSSGQFQKMVELQKF